MFEKILIANRGEIACRVIATARKLGISTVAVYSDADRTAKHVAMSDEAYWIGPPSAAESYLKAERIIEAAKRSGAQAIHPGYGFLSENPAFVDAVETAGLIFVGPPAAAIRAMGLKDAAKALMERAGVPVVQGYHGDNQDPDFLASQAEEIGYPVLIKARAGGGGKGMRRVDEPRHFAGALASAMREASTSFGDPACLIEKYIQSPRHVEIQVFADGHGQTVHLFERDCSLQRRHQKVIEEAPAPGMPEPVREAMGRAAVGAARAIDYQGAGTVEFIADGSQGLREDGFWFMEMNTRLQVEHPVTEAITGVDLVEWQLRIAAGEPLPLSQDQLQITGHAFEARIYAEDVPRGFLPAIGKLEHISLPETCAFEQGAVRVDSGVRQGDEITPHYDPMIAKLICHGPDRQQALARLSRALSGVHIAGSVTNTAFLSALSCHQGFARGEVDTGLIERDFQTLKSQPPVSQEAVALAAIKALGLLDKPISPDPFASLKGWRAWDLAVHHCQLMLNGEPIEASIRLDGGGRFTLLSGNGIELEIEPADQDLLSVSAGGFKSRARLVRCAGEITVFWQGQAFTVTQTDPLDREGDQEISGDAITAPMPGLVKVVMAKAGEAVSKGQGILVLEAMKMEHTLNAPRDGMIKEIQVRAGDQVAEGALLAALRTEE